MAEDLTGFSPLDALGPEFGGINRPNINEISLRPFEGERIPEPQINYPSPIPMPNLTNPNLNVRKQLVTKPAGQKIDIKNQRQALTDYLKSINQANQSKNQYAKIYSYDAGPDGNAFYKRYMAYGQETFDKIGFSPLRDNEANFNTYTSNWQGAKAMLTQSFMPMLTKGFISGPRDMMKMLSGDFSGTNLEDSREYEELAAIGYSSKGGLTGFFNNSAMNFGYSAGIILEALAEEVAFLALEAGTAGGATPLVAAGTASNISKIFKGIKGLSFATDFGKTMKNSLKSLSNFKDAKNFWQSVRASEKLGSVGSFFNPAENIISAVQDIKKLNAVDNLTSLAAISKTAGGFYRDIRNINMATSEARLEAGMVENKVYDKLYNQHYERFGEPPSNDEQKKMVTKSKEASIDTFYKNAGLIYLSNKLTFGNVTSPRGGIRNFIKTTKDDIVSIGNGKFGNVGKIVYNNAKKQFAFEANNVKNLAKSWYTDFGFKTAAKTVGFFKANVAEGLQENAQEVISRANERYYTESYRSPLMKSHNFTNGMTNYAAKSKSDYYLEEMDNELSMQGLQTFASGFMMGFYGAPLNNAIPFASKTFNRIFRPEAYQEYVDNKTKIAEGLVKSLNDVNIGEFLKSRFLNTGAQDIINEIRQSGTKKEAIDAELESLVNSSELMLETNTTDVFLEKLESLRQMDDKEFANTIGASETDDLNKYRQRIDSTAKKLTKIQDRYKYYNEKFPNPVDSNVLEDLDEKSDKYKDLVALQHAWKTSVKNAVFFNEAFEDTVVRMTQISDKITTTSGLKKVSAKDFQNILRPETIAGELNLLKNEINALSGIEDKTDLDKASIRAKKEKYKELENFVQSYAKFNSFFNREEYTESIKAELEDELGREPTDAEVAEIYDQVVGAIDNEDARTGVIDELKVAFNGYLKAVANQNDEIAFDENLDRAFKLLMDHYKLGQESKKMAKYANVLHDPGNFFDLVQRNKQWMRDLYERRSEYYEEIVKQEMQGVEDNALLNALASRGIYVSLDDFSKWKYDGTPPSEFFDNVNKKVIPQGTEEYLEHYELFRRAAALKEQDIDITNEIVSDQLKLELERLAKEKEQRLEALEEVPVKTGVKSIKKARFKSMSYSYILDQMETESYADLVIKNKEGQEEDLVVYKDVDGNLRIGDKDGDIINLKDKVKIKKAQQYKIEIKKDPKAVKQINREFTLRRNDLIRSSRVKNKDSFYKNEEELPTQDTPYMDMNIVLQDMLFREFSKMVFSDPVANKRLIDSEEEFDTALLKFVKEDPKAKEVIDSYNKAYQTEEKLPDERAELITPKTLEEVEQALEALYTKNLVVNPENNDTYIEVDDQGMRIPGTPTYPRVSTRKPGERKFTNKAAANRGTIIDDMLRDFVEGKITSVDDMTNLYEAHPLRNATQDFSPEFINDLFNIFTDIKKVVDRKGIKLISRIPTLWGVIDGKRYAGTIDLMGIDAKGNVFVIDLKTSTENRRDEAGELYSNFKEGDTIQQSGYAEMIRQRTGITVKNIVIFPVQTTVVKEFNQYTKAEANKDEKGNFTMQVEIDRSVFPETPTAKEEKETVTPTATIGNQQVSSSINKDSVELKLKDENGQVTKEIIVYKKGNIVVIEPIQGSTVRTLDLSETEKENLLKEFISPETLDLIYQHRQSPYDKTIKESLTQALNKDIISKISQPTKDIEAKKADIEKAGINNLLVSGLVTSPTTIEKGKQYLLVTSTGYTGIASAFEIVTATGNKKEESQVSSGSGVSKNLVDTFINEKGQEITTGGLNKKIVEVPTIDINDKKEVLTFLLNQAKSGKLLSAPKGSALGLQEFNEDKTKNRLGFLNSDFTKGETLIDYDDSNRSQNTKLAKDFLIAKYTAELAALETPTTAVQSKKAELEKKIEYFDNTIEPQFEEDDYRKVLVLAEKQVKDGTIPQTPENVQLITNYPKLFEEFIKATAARNKTIEAFDKEAVLAGKPKELPIYTIESTINPATKRLEIKWVEGRKETITNIQLTKLNNYAAEELINYKNKLQQELAALEGEAPGVTEEVEVKKSDIERRREEDLELLDKAIYNSDRWEFPGPTKEKINARYDAELAALEGKSKTDIEAQKADIEKRRQEAKNSIKLRSKLEQALLKDKEEIERTGKVDNRASSALRQMIKNEEDKIDKEYDNIILKELGEIEYKKTKILRDKKNLEEYFSKSPTEDYIELENRKKRLAKYDKELAALEGEAPGVTEEVRDRRNRLSNNLIGIVWDRLAKEGITNADPIIGTRATITNADFDKFWSNVKTEDLQKLKKLFEEQKVAELARVDELGEGAFDPKTGNLIDTATNIERYYNNLISDVSSELNETETKTPETVSEFSTGVRLIAKNDVFYKDKAGNNSIFAEAQSTVVVTKVDEKTGKVTVTPLGNSNSMEYTLEDINSNFEKESTVMQKTQEPQEEIVITDDDKQIIKESTDSIDTFLGEFTTQADIEKAVDDPKVTLEKLDKDLLDDLKC